MSPFSKFPCDLGISRRRRQKEFAVVLGCEQSYVSSVERGTKGTPRRAFVDRLIDKLALNDAEIVELERVFTVSERRFTLSTNACPEEYQLWSRLKAVSGQLDPVRLQLIMAVLELPLAPSCADEPASCRSLGTERRSQM